MPTFDGYITSITQDHILRKVVDNVLNSNVACVRWLSKGKEWIGETLRIPFKNAKNTSAGAFGLSDVFTTAKVNTRLSLAFDPKFYYANITLFGPEVDVNAVNEAKVVDLVRTETESTMQDAMDDVGALFYSTGAGNNFLGVQGIVDDGTFLATYAGQTRSSVTNLNSNVNTVSGPLTLALMAAQHSNAKRGSMKPTIGITTEAHWDDYEELIQPQISANYTILGGAKVTRDGTVPQGAALGPGQAGFDALMFRGMPVVADEKCNSGEFYFINENFLQWYGMKSTWAKPIKLTSETIDGTYAADVPSDNHGFQFTGFKEAYNQYARAGQLLLLGNLVSGGPRYSSKLESLT